MEEPPRSSSSPRQPNEAEEVGQPVPIASTVSAFVSHVSKCRILPASAVIPRSNRKITRFGLDPICETPASPAGQESELSDMKGDRMLVEYPDASPDVPVSVTRLLILAAQLSGTVAKALHSVARRRRNRVISRNWQFGNFSRT